MTAFEQAVALTATGDGTSSFVVRPEWSQGRSAFGGLIGAVAVRAAEGAVGRDRLVRSVAIDFAAPIAPGEAHVTTRVVREGRSLSHVEVRIAQGGQEAAVGFAVAGTARPSAAVSQPVASPPAPPPEAIRSFPYVEGLTPAFTQHFDFRWASERLPFSGSKRANLGGWIRLRDGGPIDAAGVAALVDAWPAPVLALLDRPAMASTVTWMIDLVQPPPPGGWPGDTFFRYEADADAVWDGYADARAHLWAPDGRLVATSTQLVAEFSA